MPMMKSNRKRIPLQIVRIRKQVHQEGEVKHAYGEGKEMRRQAEQPGYGNTPNDLPFRGIAKKLRANQR